ncbi:hypothetical protein LOC68_07405 [Blastopirellula sp. JC732]|uniref:Carboxypeptidase regulatory-like domain-containing protein n=1 Tax=Blastopirellula sediminis TaxID=2894196 RepID=A0A9X1MKZ2_9BACT|nr:hypothetical protein [Blastopirellula sediminis]MCC9609006.1 hypothetical protein [Blastopirellula sediminis]MCC9628217.1 hypothetical protein [Blastopirellula sediminis]
MRLSLFLLCGLLIGTIGCGGGSSGPKTYAVTGSVTFDGQPVETGRILLRQLEGGGKAFAGDIINGKYKVDAEEGAAKVEVTASRLIPGKFDNSNGTPEPIGEMYIPAKYNSKSDLKADVTPSGDNEFSFELKSK